MMNGDLFNDLVLFSYDENMQPSKSDISLSIYPYIYIYICISVAQHGGCCPDRKKIMMNILISSKEKH